MQETATDEIFVTHIKKSLNTRTRIATKSY